jgi:hypothetical protein
MNDTRKNVSKIIEGTAVAIVAAVVAGASVELAKRTGIAIPEEAQSAAVASVMVSVVGLLSGIKNWWKHRK